MTEAIAVDAGAAAAAGVEGTASVDARLLLAG
jgi:hypothetical protein